MRYFLIDVITEQAVLPEAFASLEAAWTARAQLPEPRGVIFAWQDGQGRMRPIPEEKPPPGLHGRPHHAAGERPPWAGNHTPAPGWAPAQKWRQT
jgi:hypothetical protein